MLESWNAVFGGARIYIFFFSSVINIAKSFKFEISGRACDYFFELALIEVYLFTGQVLGLRSAVRCSKEAERLENPKSWHFILVVWTCNHIMTTVESLLLRRCTLISYISILAFVCDR